MAGVRRIADRFEIVREIGEGAFAHVYRARDTTSGREVALKLLKDSMRQDTEALERFRREVFAVASIDSPHVVALHDFGMSGADVFIAMEYVEGPTLRDLSLGKPWQPEPTRLIVGQIAQALTAAHGKSIVHRDLKPENVILVKGARARQVKVLDFGLAKLAELEQRLELEPLTQVGMCFGTPHYMSPEQIQGRAAERSADLWALSVMAYELVSGQLPWDGDDAHAVFRRVLGAPLPPLRATHPSVTRKAELEQFFARALSKNPRDRFADARQLFTAFETALLGAGRTDARFSGIISEEFAIPALGPEAERKPVGNSTDPMPSLSDTLEEKDQPDATIPGAAFAHTHGDSRRRLRSGWAMSLQNVPTLPPPPSGSPSQFDSSESSVSPIAETIERPRYDGAPKTFDGNKRSETMSIVAPPRSLSPILVAVILILVAAAGAAGYFLGKSH
jgi:serine/threonine protein kinase